MACSKGAGVPCALSWAAVASGSLYHSRMMTPKEREAVGLAVCVEALQSFVNHLLLHFTPVTSRPGEMEVRFHTSVHRDLFLIRFEDFFREKGSADVLGSKMSCMEVLRTAAAERNFEVNSSGSLLTSSVQALADWIAQAVEPKLWLPTLEVEARLSVTRAQLLNIAGNQAKHNPSRLSEAAGVASGLLREKGYEVPAHQAPFVLNEFRDHLHENFFIYYASWMAELLNDVRWGIQRYLEPLFHASIVREGGDSPLYHYDFPAEVTSEAARLWFWELMNHVRSGPPVQPLKASRFLREQSSLEH